MDISIIKKDISGSIIIPKDLRPEGSSSLIIASSVDLGILTDIVKLVIAFTRPCNGKH